MKKIISFTTAFFIILCVITTNSFAQSSLPSEVYKTYFDIAYKLMYGKQYSEDFGLGIFNAHNVYYDTSTEYSFYIEYETGLAFADLIDFDNNGTQELFLFYITPGENFTYDVYSYNGNGLVKIYSKQGSLTNDFSLNLVRKNNKTL